MAIDVDTPDSPGWWFRKLARDLARRRPALDKLDGYYRGEPPLPVGIASMSEEFKQFQRLAHVNHARLITAATRERWQLLGFRTAASGDEDGDQVAARMMAANEIPVVSANIHRYVASLGSGYSIVGDIDDETGEPTITAEDPRQVITAHDPLLPHRVRAAAKVFHDEDLGKDLAYVYNLGDPRDGRDARASVRRASRPGRSSLKRFSPGGWSWDDEYDGIDGQLLPFNRIPVVRFENEDGVGEYEPYTDHLDRINFWIFQAMVIALHQAHRQRAIKSSALLAKLDELKQAGVDMMIDPRTGRNAIDDMFRSDPGALWTIPDDAEMWESGQTQLSEISGMIEKDEQRLAAVTRTPLFYMTADATNGSAEGASLSRESLVWKSGDRIVRVKQGWRTVAALGFLFKGDLERADYAAIDVLMADPERHSLAEKADAATKYKASGVPWPTTMSDALQFTPSDIRRMRSERVEDFLAAADQMIDEQPAAA